MADCTANILPSESCLLKFVIEEHFDAVQVLGLLSPLKSKSSLDFGPADIIHECFPVFPEKLNFPSLVLDEETAYKHKVEDERIYFQNILTDLVEDLNNQKSFDKLVRTLELERAKKLEYIQLQLRLEKLKKAMNNLHLKPQEAIRLKHEEIKKQEQCVLYLQDRISEAKKSIEVKNQFSDCQLKAEKEQLGLKLNEENVQLEARIQEMKLKIEDEKKIYGSIIKFLSQNNEISEKKLEEWKIKYTENVTSYDTNIAEKKAELEKLRTRIGVLNKQREECWVVIEEDRKEKLKIKQEQDLRKQEMQSAIFIQAWWRAVMVRKFIGYYKPLKKLFKSKKGKEIKGKKSTTENAAKEKDKKKKSQSKKKGKR